MPDAAPLVTYAVGGAGAPKQDMASRAGAPGSAIAAMHHTIEQRLMWGAHALAVIPLRPQPLEVILSRLSFLAGWVTVAAVASTVAYGVIAIVR